MRTGVMCPKGIICQYVNRNTKVDGKMGPAKSIHYKEVFAIIRGVQYQTCH